MTNELIKVQGLVKKWGYKIVLDELCFTAFPYEIIAIQGVNGSGKTTFLQLLSGFTNFTQGNVSIMGCKIPHAFQSIKHHLGVLCHEPMLYRDLSVLENLRFFGKLYRVDNIKKRIDTYTSLMGLKIVLHEQIKVLSKGTLQKVAICRLFLHDPQIILMDEPYSNLDEEGVNLVQQLITSAQKQGKLTIIATHDCEAASRICNRIELLQNGKLHRIQ